MIATDRMVADSILQKALKRAGRAAGALGNVLLSKESSEHLKRIIQRIESLLTGHRVVLPYSWLLLALQ